MSLKCSKCGAEKREDEFCNGTHRTPKRNGKSVWCKLCKREYDTVRMENLKESPEWVAKEKQRHVNEYIANFPKHWASRQASRAKKAGSSGFVSWEEWQGLLEQHINKCHWCKCDLHPSFLTLDHVKSLAEGGLHIKDNVVPACANCNHKRKWESQVKYPELYPNLQNT